MKLKKLLKIEPTRDELLAVFQQFWQEQNSRAAAIGAAAMAEVGLSNTLRARLWIKDDAADDGLFGADGPISTFSQKIRMAEAIRLIGPLTRANFNRIKEIRNAFAHTHRSITFDTPEIAIICEAITLDVRPQRPRPPYISSPRDQYVYASLALFIALSEIATQTRAGEPADPWSAYPVQHWWGEKYPAPLP